METKNYFRNLVENTFLALSSFFTKNPKSEKILLPILYMWICNMIKQKYVDFIYIRCTFNKPYH